SPLILTLREVIAYRQGHGSRGRGRAERGHETGIVEGGRAGEADRADGAGAAPLRRDRAAAALAAHRGGAPALHGPRRGAAPADPLVAAGRLRPGRDPRLPGSPRLLAAGGDPAPGRAAAGPDRDAAEVVRAARGRRRAAPG